MMVQTYVPGFGRLRQEGHHFEASLCYSERSWGQRVKHIDLSLGQYLES